MHSGKPGRAAEPNADGGRTGTLKSWVVLDSLSTGQPVRGSGVFAEGVASIDADPAPSTTL
jgi:hypothetical protein